MYQRHSLIGCNMRQFPIKCSGDCFVCSCSATIHIGTLAHLPSKAVMEQRTHTSARGQRNLDHWHDIYSIQLVCYIMIGIGRAESDVCTRMLRTLTLTTAFLHGRPWLKWQLNWMTNNHWRNKQPSMQQQLLQQQISMQQQLSQQQQYRCPRIDEPHNNNKNTKRYYRLDTFPHFNKSN